MFHVSAGGDGWSRRWNSLALSLLTIWWICFIKFKFAFYSIIGDVFPLSTLMLTNDQWKWEWQLLYTVIRLS